MINTYNSLPPIFLNFTTINVQNFEERSCIAAANIEITRSSNKKLNVTFQKTKLGI